MFSRVYNHLSTLIKNRNGKFSRHIIPIWNSARAMWIYFLRNGTEGGSMTRYEVVCRQLANAIELMAEDYGHDNVVDSALTKIADGLDILINYSEEMVVV